jgi:hypothetical protein
MVSKFELAWSYYFFDDIGHSLYEAIRGHQYWPQNSYYVGMIGMCLNQIILAQKTHELGKYVAMPDQDFPPQYNLILNFIQNLKLSELSRLDYLFLRNQRSADGGEFQVYAWWKSCGIVGDSTGLGNSKVSYLQAYPQGRFAKEMQ